MLSFLGNKKKQFAPSVQCKTCPQTGIKVFGNISPIYIYGQDLILLCPPFHPLPTTLPPQVDSRARPVLPFLPSRRSPLLWIGASVSWATLARLDQTETKIFIGWLEGVFPLRKLQSFLAAMFFFAAFMILLHKLLFWINFVQTLSAIPNTVQPLLLQE